MLSWDLSLVATAQCELLILCKTFIHRSAWLHVSNNGSDVIFHFPITPLWHYVIFHFQIILAIRNKSSQSWEKTWLKDNFPCSEWVTFLKSSEAVLETIHSFYQITNRYIQLWLVASTLVPHIQFQYNAQNNWLELFRKSGPKSTPFFDVRIWILKIVYIFSTSLCTLTSSKRLKRPGVSTIGKTALSHVYIVDAGKLYNFPFSTNFLKPIGISPLQNFDLLQGRQNRKCRCIWAKQREP